MKEQLTMEQSINRYRRSVPGGMIMIEVIGKKLYSIIDFHTAIGYNYRNHKRLFICNGVLPKKYNYITERI